MFQENCFFYQENEQSNTKKMSKVTHTRDYLKPYIIMHHINQHKNGVELSLMTSSKCALGT